MAIQVDTAGIKKISELTIDNHKDFAAKKIENIGAPDTDNDVPRRDTIDDKITIHGEGAKHRWTLDKLRKGAGSEADPTEIGVPAGATIVRKTSDQTVNNEVTLQNDDDLLLPVGASDVWLVHLFLYHNSSVGADLDYAFAVPTNGTCWALEAVNKSSPKTISNMTGETMVTGTGINNYLHVFLLYIGGVNAGSLQLQWAQHEAEVSDTKVLAQSFMMGIKLA